MAGVASSGDSTLWSRANHRHPSDTSRAPIDSPSFTGIPLAPTPAPGDNSTRIATTAFLKSEVATGYVAKTGDTMTGPLLVPQGLVTAGGLQLGIPGVGLSASGTGANVQLSFNTAGVSRMTVNAQSVSTNIQFRSGAGTAAAPIYSFGPGTDSGMFWRTGGVVGLSAGGTEVFNLTSANVTSLVPLTLPAGVPTLPAHAANKAYVDTIAGLAPPPSDGKTYAMKNGVWVAIDLGTKWDRT